MKYFASFMKYITFTFCLLNALFLVICIYDGTILNVITSFVNEATFIIQCYVWNEFAFEYWDCE